METLRVAVLTCGDLGLEVAVALTQLAGVRGVSVLTSPYRFKHRTPLQQMKHVYRMEGPGEVVRAIARKAGILPRPAATNRGSDWTHAATQAGVTIVPVDDFHSTTARAALAGLKPDLGVVAGTYILRKEVFAIPRLGCINLHSGKAPEYRGAAPGFWELYNGESSVGITIHWVTEKLDAGTILHQELFPLEAAPAQDPLAYLLHYRSEVLRPNGVRLLTAAVADIAAGRGTGVPQNEGASREFRSPTYRDKQELRRRVRVRRRQVDQ